MADELVALGAVVAAVVAIWRGLIAPLIVALDKARVLSKIADEFSTNGGSTLRDTIDTQGEAIVRIETKLDALAAADDDGEGG